MINIKKNSITLPFLGLITIVAIVNTAFIAGKQIIDIQSRYTEKDVFMSSCLNDNLKKYQCIVKYNEKK